MQMVFGSSGLFKSSRKSSPESTQYRAGEAILFKGIVAEAICPCNWSWAPAARADANGLIFVSSCGYSDRILKIFL